MTATPFPKQGKNFPKRAKRRLLDLDLSITDLGRKLDPRRPRSTVSTAIHTDRFPNVRKQIVTFLGL